MNYFGIKVIFTENKIEIEPKSNIKNKVKLVESDWSSASYYFSIVSLCKEAKISLKNFNKKSLQGDSVLPNIYEKLGVKTTFIENEIIISKMTDFNLPKMISLDLTDSPDIAQTIAVSCFGLGVGCELSGLKTLKIKLKLYQHHKLKKIKSQFFPTYYLKKRIKLKILNIVKLVVEQFIQ